MEIKRFCSAWSVVVFVSYGVWFVVGFLFVCVCVFIVIIIIFCFFFAGHSGRVERRK